MCKEMRETGEYFDSFKKSVMSGGRPGVDRKVKMPGNNKVWAVE